MPELTIFLDDGGVMNDNALRGPEWQRLATVWADWSQKLRANKLGLGHGLKPHATTLCDPAHGVLRNPESSSSSAKSRKCRCPGNSPTRENKKKDGVSSTGGCNSVLEFSGWGHEAEGLTGAGVQFQGDAVQVLLAVR